MYNREMGTGNGRDVGTLGDGDGGMRRILYKTM